MKLTGEALKREIEKASTGLLFSSETDSPVSVVYEKASEPRAELRDVARKLAGVARDADVDSQSVGRFFRPATETRDWFGAEENARAERFGALVGVLKANLRDVKVYRVGETTIQAFVLGRAANGDVAGVRTEVVET